MSRIQQDAINREGERDFYYSVWKGEVLRAYSLMIKAEIKKIDKGIAAQEIVLKDHEKTLNSENHRYEQLLKRTEKKAVDERMSLEKELKSNQEKDAKIKILSDKIQTIKSEITVIEGALHECKKDKNVLVELSPLDWQEAQRAEALKAKVTNSELDGDSSEYEEKVYFSNPQELVDHLSYLMDVNLMLINNINKVNQTLEELHQTHKSTSKRVSEEEEKLESEINDITKKLQKEQSRAAELKKKLQLHEGIHSENEDILLDSLSVRVSELYQSCAGGGVFHLGLLDKLYHIEQILSSMIDKYHDIPEENVEVLNQAKDCEKRSRLRIEKHREEYERELAKIKKCAKRNLAETRVMFGRKLVPRCTPFDEYAEEVYEDNTVAEPDFYNLWE